MSSIDLHSHSYYSDGVLSPTDLLSLAKQQGCQIFSLTDHDSMGGLNEAQQQADTLDIRLINGVEISVLWKNRTVHIVGLGVDKNNILLNKGLAEHQQFRQVRAQKMAEGLERAGIKGIREAVNVLSSYTPTRTHFAQALVQQGVCRDMKTVFKRFLVGNKPGAVSNQWASLSEAINWIVVAGGVAVVAHPFRYRLSQAKIKELLSDFKEAGGQGIEVVISHSSDDEITQAAKLAKHYGLLGSMGSDYHGWQGQNCKLAALNPLPNGVQSVMSVL